MGSTVLYSMDLNPFFGSSQKYVIYRNQHTLSVGEFAFWTNMIFKVCVCAHHYLFIIYCTFLSIRWSVYLFVCLSIYVILRGKSNYYFPLRNIWPPWLIYTHIYIYIHTLFPTCQVRVSIKKVQPLHALAPSLLPSPLASFGPCLDPSTISPAPDAAGHAWAWTIWTHAGENARKNIGIDASKYIWIDVR